MFRLKIILTFILICSYAFSQTPAEANATFESGNYSEAIPMYENLLKKKPKEALYQYRIGVAAYKTGDFEKAVKHLENSGNKFPLRNYYLGEMFFDHYLFEKSALAYENYFSTLHPGDSLYSAIEKKLNQAKLGENFIKRVEDVEIVDSTVVDKSHFLAGMPLTHDLGILKQQQLDLGTKGKIDDIQYTTQRGDRMYFSEFLNDNSDLFTSLKLLDSWSEKQPLEDLNTAANENYPFLLSDGITLYFASDSENSMGGYDIFITRLNTSDNTFLKPENIGMPFNSPFNDYMYVLDEFRNVGWFASDRYQPEGKVAIYRFIPNKEKKIIRTENVDSLIDRARITIFSQSKKVFAENKIDKQQTIATSNSIFINDKTSYLDAKDFKSNVARNHYFQVQKLTEEKQSIENQLAKLRQDYRTAAGQNKQNISQSILQLESRLRDLPELIRSHTLQMRIEENK